MRSNREWFVYVIRCCDGSLYTGRTTDVARRFEEHRTGRGARYTRSHPPVAVVYFEGGHDASSSGRREAAIKKLTKSQKESLVSAAAEG